MGKFTEERPKYLSFGQIAEMEEDYKPINCSFYDYFEKYATLRKRVKLRIKDSSDEEVEVESLIHDLKTEDKAEYALLDNNEWVRLDRIVSIRESNR